MLRCLMLLVILALPSVGLGADKFVLLKENGGWCWFQGERAVVVEGKLFFTSIAGAEHGGWQRGDLVATCYDLTSGRIEHFTLHERFQSDDHDVAGLCVLPDQRLLAVYGKHGSDPLQRSRITQHPANISQWSSEQTLDVGRGYTYSNVFRLRGEGDRIFNFHRGLGFNPNCTISDDGGASWRYGFRLLQWERKQLTGDPRFTGLDGGRPYVRYASDGGESIHFLLSDDHPRGYDNSVYHGSYRQGAIYSTDGNLLGRPTAEGQSTLKPGDFTEIFRGSPEHVAWPCAIEVDDRDRPYVVFSVQVDGAATRSTRGQGGADHRYYYGRWDGSRWNVHQMAYAGTKLYAGEDDYTGLAALDPKDPNRAVISTNADPITGEPLVSSADAQRHWELFAGTTADSGKTWQWTAITSNSAEDQLRPIIVDAPLGRSIVLWLRGQLRSYTDYNLDVMSYRLQ